MLLRFSVENHRSIRDRQELSMVASSLKDASDGLLEAPSVPGGRVVPSALIYGANASGKSSVVSAMDFFRISVLRSHYRSDPEGPIGRSPFALASESRIASSRFEADFVVDGIRYHYGFLTSDDAFLEEWLLSFPLGRSQLLFKRNGQEFEFGRKLKGRNRIISELTRPNSLFASVAIQNDHEQLVAIVQFFSGIGISVSTTMPRRQIMRSNIPEDRYQRLMRFLDNAATGIVAYRFRKEERRIYARMARTNRQESGQLSLPGFLNAETTDEETIEKVEILELGHQGEDGTHVFFDIREESDGTQRLVSLLNRVFAALDRGGVLVVDELEAHLHTQVAEQIIGLFSSSETNPKGAQLIATTHDTNLLRSPFLRRDQIWFTEKDGGGATHLYPLSDFTARAGDNLEKGYLQGRFGAIPFAGSALSLMD